MIFNLKARYILDCYLYNLLYGLAVTNLQEEESYANQLTVNQQRAMHCSFVEQQKLLALTNEEKLFHMQLKGRVILKKLICHNLCKLTSQ